MSLESFFVGLFHHTESGVFSYVAIGFGCGMAITGTFAAFAIHFYSKRMLRWRVLDEVRRELRDPLLAYVEWLHAVSAEFSVWKVGLLLRFSPHNHHDQFELNRLRRLFVDPRGQLWFSRIEEYEPVLGKFRKVSKELWLRQVQLSEQFQRVFRSIEKDPPAASKNGHTLENLAFEQSQLVSDFLYQLQYECLKSVADSNSKIGKSQTKPRIERTRNGQIRVAEPMAHLTR